MAPRPRLVAGVPVVVLIGLAMPMLGWSLLGFLVVDGLVGLVALGPRGLDPRARSARVAGEEPAAGPG